MKGVVRTLLAAAIAIGVLAYRSGSVSACGPFIERAIFTFEQHPDYPLAQFAAGTLGVLQPTYAQSYLTVAFRYLSGVPLDTDTQAAVQQLWRFRMERGPDDRWMNAVTAWIARRGAVASTPTGLDASPLFRRSPSSPFVEYPNCQADAFRRAIQTLDAIERDSSRAVATEWVRNQDLVFANCGGGEQIPQAMMSEPLQPGLDRAYQVAAAEFYAGRFVEAERDFRALGSGPASRWSALAPYLVARTLVRRATVLAPEGQIDRTQLLRADTQLRLVLENPALADIHDAARRLRAFVSLRLDPGQRVHELATALMDPRTPPAEWKQTLDDYTWILDKPLSPQDIRQDELTDWIRTFQVHSAEATDHAAERWNTTRRVAWLIALLEGLSPEDPRAVSALAAADGIKWGDAAFPSIAYYAALLKVDAGQYAAARRDLDPLVTTRADALPRSARNLFLSLRMRAASSLDEFVRFAVRLPAGSYTDSLTEPYDAPETRLGKMPGLRLFDEDAAAVINDRLSLAEIVSVARHPELPVNLRRQVVLAGWTRAVLLGDTAAARSLATLAATLAPSSVRDQFTDYAREEDATRRSFAAVMLLLRTPGLRPLIDSGLERETAIDHRDIFHDNWWCARDPKDAPLPAFLATGDRAVAVDERGRLRALGPASTYLANEAVRLARLLPADPRSPEALHLAVQATRYGCTDETTGDASRRAFQWLHAKYPSSSWAKNTPFWYRG